jgi:hypothetical protein
VAGGLKQGDQIGQIFAQCVIVYFGQSFKNYRNGPHIWATLFSRLQLCIDIDKKMYWATLWAIFSQANLATLIPNIFYNHFSIAVFFLLATNIFSITMTMRNQISD